MYTIDASVHVSALNPREQNSEASQAFLAGVFQSGVEVYAPTLLVVEVAAAIARAFDDAGNALSLGLSLRGLPGLRLISLDDALMEEAAELAATHRLRGADAVYAAVARRHGTTLITTDRQQLERLAGVIPVRTPQADSPH